MGQSECFDISLRGRLLRCQTIHPTGGVSLYAGWPWIAPAPAGKTPAAAVRDLQRQVTAACQHRLVHGPHMETLRRLTALWANAVPRRDTDAVPSLLGHLRWRDARFSHHPESGHQLGR